MKQAGADLIWLCRCALHGTVPEPERIQKTNLVKLQEMARFHSLTALTAAVLLKAGVQLPSEWTEARWKSVRKNLLLDAERAEIEAFLEENNIPFAPLKGILLKELYPEAGMREMADQDMLCDSRGREKLAAFMEKRGYSSSCIGRGNHDIFKKPPVYHFEMHTALFGTHQNPQFAEYFRKMEENLLRSGSGCRKRLSDEEHYLYLTAHAFRHHAEGGTGVRTLLDFYLYLQNYGAFMNWEELSAGLDELGLTEYEATLRTLAHQLFAGEGEQSLTDKQREMLEYCLFSGTFGTTAHRVQKAGKWAYLRQRLFPDMAFYREFYPFFCRHRLLLPIAWLIRLFRAVLMRRNHLKKELNAILKKHNRRNNHDQAHHSLDTERGIHS